MASNSDVLPIDLDQCIDLYFACETAEERDGFVLGFGQREGELADSFLHAMMVEDKDPYIRLRAASVLAKRGSQLAEQIMGEALTVSSDDDLLRAAIDALLEVRGSAAADELLAIFCDTERGHVERRLAQDGLMAADLSRAAEAFVSLLESPQPIALDLLQGMMPALLAGTALLARSRLALAARQAQSERMRAPLREAVSRAATEQEREVAEDRADEADEYAAVLRSCRAELDSEL